MPHIESYMKYALDPCVWLMSTSILKYEQFFKLNVKFVGFKALVFGFSMVDVANRVKKNKRAWCVWCACYLCLWGICRWVIHILHIDIQLYTVVVFTHSFMVQAIDSFEGLIFLVYSSSSEFLVWRQDESANPERTAIVLITENCVSCKLLSFR